MEVSCRSGVLGGSSPAAWDFLIAFLFAVSLLPARRIRDRIFFIPAAVKTTNWSSYRKTISNLDIDKMERSLLSILIGGESSGGQSIFSSIKYAVLPIIKVFTMCFMGFLMASKKVNILTANGRKLLNGLVFSLLLPCLIFSQLGRAITLQTLLEWWFIPVNVVLGSISGSLIGLIVAFIVRPPYPYFRFTVIHIGIGNIGNIPLVLIAALCRGDNNPFGETCSQDGNAYISFGQWVGAIILYTYVFQMLALPPGETYDNLAEKNLPIKVTDHSSAPDPPPEYEPLVEEPKAIESDSFHREKISTILGHLVQKLKIKEILFQPPILASVLAIIIGVVPFLKRLVLTDDAPLFFFTDSCLILGEAMIPCILLALGGNLVDGPGVGSSRLGFRTTAAIIFARLVFVPPAGLGIVTLADKLGFIPPGDKMFKFVLLLQHTMPTSVLSGAVSNLRGCGKESAAILFWVHIFAVFSMAGWMTLYLSLLF